MVEESYAGEGHGDVVLVAGGNDMVVADTAASLRHIRYSTLVAPLNVVTEGEEGIAAEADAGVLCNPCSLLLARKDLGALGEELLPCTVSQHIVMVIADVDVDGVVTIGTTDARHEGQGHHLGVLAQPPDVSLLTS